MGDHSDIDHSGLTGVGGGFTGLIPMWVVPHTANGVIATEVTASRARITPVILPGPMKLRACGFSVSVAGSGTVEWGLFDCSASATACTKVAGGSGALNATGTVEIAATGAPVDIPAGQYYLITKMPAANVPTLNRTTVTASAPFQANNDAFAWDDTPDITGFAAVSSVLHLYLRGDIDGSNQWP